MGLGMGIALWNKNIIMRIFPSPKFTGLKSGTILDISLINETPTPKKELEKAKSVDNGRSYSGMMFGFLSSIAPSSTESLMSSPLNVFDITAPFALTLTGIGAGMAGWAIKQHTKIKGHVKNVANARRQKFEAAIKNAFDKHNLINRKAVN